MPEHDVVVFDNYTEAVAYVRSKADTDEAIEAIMVDPWIKERPDSDNNSPCGIMLAGTAYRRNVRRIVLYTAGQLMGIDRYMNGMIICQQIGEDEEARRSVLMTEHLPYPGGGAYANCSGGYDPKYVSLKNWAKAFAQLNRRRAAA